MRVLWPALPDFGNQSLLFLGSGAALWPFPPCGGWTVVGCCWPWPANGMGSICAGMRGWWRSILRRFRSGCFWGFPCLFRHGLLPLSPESSFCLALGRCEGTGSIGQNFSGCLLRQTGGTFVGSLLITGALVLPLPLKHRTEGASLCGCFGNSPLPGYVLPGFYLVVFISLPNIRYCQHLPNGNLSQVGTNSLDFDIRPKLGQVLARHTIRSQ